eukprot:TRINITY_DN5380_c0_g1_i6.p1 TRINITY_DN5380_c0_g1~~TRINITY_DN5380_c0_g1_i6.p1  ORF type:complete len:1053 (-),score=289.51 TRINITY_DN5380_c0_g1_i6:169-3327(-)
MPPKASGGTGQAVTFEPVPAFELPPSVVVQHRPVAALPAVFSAPPAAVDPGTDPKETAGALKEFEGFWGAADAPFEDEAFDRESLPGLDPEGEDRLSFGAVTAWKRASDWIAEKQAAMVPEEAAPAEAEEGAEGEEAAHAAPGVKLCVVSVVGASEHEEDRLQVELHQLKEKPAAPEAPAEGEEAAPPEATEDEDDPTDPHIEEAIEGLRFEASRRIRGFETNAVEQSMEWLAGMLGMVASMRSQVPKGEYLWETIYPQTPDGRPQVSPNGKYIVKLWVHGDWRSVVVDDWLPFGEDGMPLLLRSRGTEHEVELWPLLLSKAAIKVFGKRSDGCSLTNAMGYASAITGKTVQLVSTHALGAGLDKALKSTVQSGSLCTIGLLVPSVLDPDQSSEAQPGIHPLGVHTVCDHRVGGHSTGSTALLRLESTRSEFLAEQENSLVKLQAEPGKLSRETDLESKFQQLAATVDWMAETQSVPGVMSSFWVESSSVAPLFGSALVMHSVSRMEHSAMLSHSWEQHSVPLSRNPTMVVCCENEEPTDLIVTLSQPPATWTAPELEPPEEDAPAPEPAIEPPIARASAVLESWDWKQAGAKRVGTLSTEMMSSAVVRVCAGQQLLRVNLNAPLGYTASVASKSPFAAGPIEAVLKESLGLGSVEKVVVPLAAVACNTAQVVLRLNVTTTAQSRVAAYIEVADPSLEGHLKLSLVDNEAEQATEYMSLFMPATVMEPSTRGYTLMMEARAGPGQPAIPSSTATVYLLSEEEGVTGTVDTFAEARKSVGDQELNLSKDTVLLKYVLQPSDVKEAASVELHVSGTERQVEMRLLDTQQQTLQTTQGVRGHATMMYVPLCQQAADTWTLFVNVLAPDSDVASKEASAEHEDGVIKCHWELIVRSRTTFPISIDTRRQDMAVQVKAKWEDADKGRSERAKHAREAYLSPAEAEEGAEPVKTKAMPGNPPAKVNAMDQEQAEVVSSEQREQHLETISKTVEHFNTKQGEALEMRGAAVAKWTKGNEARVAAWGEVKGGVESHWEVKSKRPTGALKVYFESLELPAQ